MKLSYKYRLYPAKVQIAFLTGQLAEACSLYNVALEERIGAWKLQRKSIQVYDQHKQLPAMRKDGCLKLVTAQVAQDVLHRLDKTFKAFFARIKRGEKAGFPRYRSARRYDSITYPQYPAGVKLSGNKLRVQGAGHIKVKLHRPVEGTVKTVTIKREADRWFVIFSVETDIFPLPKSSEQIGVDVGLTSFATLSNGTKIENPRYYKKAQAKLRRSQRKVARRKKGSNRRRKAIIQLQRAHVHVKNQRSDFHHKVSRQLINQFGVIAIEDLNVKGLIAKDKFNKSIHDAGWSLFFAMLVYKAVEAGRQLVKVDPRGTSQTCLCGTKVPKTLYDRWHRCPSCGLSGDRDYISAKVILQRAGAQPSGANVDEVMSCVS